MLNLSTNFLNPATPQDQQTLNPKPKTANHNGTGALHRRRLQAHCFIADALLDPCSSRLPRFLRRGLEAAIVLIVPEFVRFLGPHNTMTGILLASAACWPNPKTASIRLVLALRSYVFKQAVLLVTSHSDLFDSALNFFPCAYLGLLRAQREAMGALCLHRNRGNCLGH